MNRINNNNNNNNNNICLFQTHKIGTAYICRSIHIVIKNSNTRQSIWGTVHKNDNSTCMTVMLSYYVMMHVQWFYPVPPNARGPSNVWDKNYGYYRISRQVKSCHKSKDQVTNDSFTIWYSTFRKQTRCTTKSWSWIDPYLGKLEVFLIFSFIIFLTIRVFWAVATTIPYKTLPK